MIQSFQALTTFHVEDNRRPWGKAADVLMEYPSCRNCYLGIKAHVGPGVKEIWAPLESLAGLDPRGNTLYIDCDLDKDLVGRLSRLEAPVNDTAELKLHRLYHSKPAWTKDHVKPDGTKRKYTLRKRSRMVRLSSLLDWETMTRDGAKGRIIDLLLDRMSLQTLGFELELRKDKSRVRFILDEGRPFLLDRGDHALYLDSD